MNNIFIELITNEIFLTIISGTLVFILGQLFIELFINPRRKFIEIKQKINYSLTLYKCYFSNPYNLVNEEVNVCDINEYVNASHEIRVLGSELSGYLATIPAFQSKKKKKIEEIVDSLIGISNGLFIISKNYNPIIDTKKYEEIIKKNI